MCSAVKQAKKAKTDPAAEKKALKADVKQYVAVAKDDIKMAQSDLKNGDFFWFEFMLDTAINNLKTAKKAATKLAKLDG